MKYKRILTEIYHRPWAILPEKLAAITDLVKFRASGGRLSEQEVRARLAPYARSGEAPEMKLMALGSAKPGQTPISGYTALIPVYGIISHRMNLMSQISGATSVEKLTGQFRQALANPDVKVIVFDVDSPGGSVEGVPELADEILRSRGSKKTVAVANSLAASAAYWIASAAEEVVVIPSGQVGSIGVFCEHDDVSKALEQEGVKVSLISAGKYKIEGNPYEPLSDEARAAMQQKVDAFYSMFVKNVAKGRGVSQAAVREGFGQGRCVVSADALKGGMVDRVATLDATLTRLGTSAPPKIGAAARYPQLVAGDLDECQCECSPCLARNCDACTNAECQDPMCVGCPNQSSNSKSQAPRRTLRSMELLRRELDSGLLSSETPAFPKTGAAAEQAQLSIGRRRRELDVRSF